MVRLTSGLHWLDGEWSGLRPERITKVLDGEWSDLRPDCTGKVLDGE